MSTIPHYLPIWAQWAQTGSALATSVATCGAVVAFGFWQLQIAREKLRHDLYDRRYNIFLAFHRLLAAHINGTDLKEHFQATGFALPQAAFLLPKNIALHLHELHREIFAVSHLEELYRKEKHQFERETQIQALQDVAQRKIKLVAAVDRLQELFAPVLCLDDLSTVEWMPILWRKRVRSSPQIDSSPPFQ